MKMLKHIESILIVSALLLGGLVAAVQLVTDPGVASRVITIDRIA